MSQLSNSDKPFTVWLVGLFAAALAALAAGALYLTEDPTRQSSSVVSVAFALLVVGFVVAESTAVHIEIRKHSHTISLSGIPMLFGLLYVSPVALVVAYLVAGIPILLISRRLDLLKAIWNLCLFAAEAAIAALVVWAVLGLEVTPDDVGGWVVVLAGVLAAELLSLVTVPLVIMAFEGKLRPQLFNDLGRAQLLAAVAGSFTVTAAAASTSNPLMALFAALPVISVAALLRTHANLAQSYSDLEQLHGFTRTLSDHLGSRTVDIGLASLTKIMRSKRAGLITRSGDSANKMTMRCLNDGDFTNGSPRAFAEVLFELTAGEAVVVLTSDDPRYSVQEILFHFDAQEMIVASVLGEADQCALLYVADRLGVTHFFSAEEVSLFGSLSRTFSSRLSNDHLVRELETQAQHDALTGLPNRLNFEVALSAKLLEKDSTGVVVMLDLDRFKDVNDSLGHEVGDQLLNVIASRLRGAVRSGDMVSRFGGDEFAVFLGRQSAEENMIARLSRLHEQLAGQAQLEGIMFEIGASLGAVAWPEFGNTSEDLLRKSDVAMYDAKRTQKGVVWYSADLDENAPRRLELSLAVRSALNEHELEVYLQPKVSLATGKVTSAEALVRWDHPTYGAISPEEFVPLLYQAGMIGGLTRFVLSQAAEFAKKSKDAGSCIPISVNFTPRDLLDPDLPGHIAEILSTHGLVGADLVVEITEDAMIVDLEASIASLERIRELGIRISLDDFGTGYSSLQHLHRLPVDELKIDRSFVSSLNLSEDAAAIVRASIGLARDLGMKTVGEGVEDLATVNSLIELGCDEVQGFFVSPPIPCPEFGAWLRDWEPDHLFSAVIFRKKPLVPG